MRFALFTSPESFVDEVDLIEKIFDAEFSTPEFLYIDKPHLKDLALERFLLSLPEKIRNVSFLCGSPNVAAEFGLMGFHATADWFRSNEAAAVRFAGALSAEISDAKDFEILPENLRGKMKNFVCAENVFGGWGFATSLIRTDATDIPAEVQNAAIVSGIWEFADPVAAWRRLCR